MTKIFRILGTESDGVADSAAVNFAAREYPWHARVLADVPVFVAVGISPTATTGDFYVNEFDPHVFAVAAGEEVSVLGTDAGFVWVTEVLVSA